MTRNLHRVVFACTIVAFAASATPPTAAADETGSRRHKDPAAKQHHEDTGFGHPGDPSQADARIAITARDLAFSPKSITVTQGETVTFVVTNNSKLQHELVIGPRAEQVEHDKEMRNMSAKEMAEDMKNDRNGIVIKPGQTRTITWTFSTRLHRMQYACHIPGHYQAGMYGVIHIRRST